MSPDRRDVHDAREAMSLAFVATLQLLNPCQRAVLVLRDVLGFRTREVAVMLDSTEEAVNSALKHARAHLQSRLPPPGAPAPAPQSHAELAIVGRIVTAYEDGNVSALVSLLTDDVTVTAPMTAGAFSGPGNRSISRERHAGCHLGWGPRAGHDPLRQKCHGTIRAPTTSPRGPLDKRAVLNNREHSAV